MSDDEAGATNSVISKTMPSRPAGDALDVVVDQVGDHIVGKPVAYFAQPEQAIAVLQRQYDMPKNSVQPRGAGRVSGYPRGTDTRQVATQRRRAELLLSTPSRPPSRVPSVRFHPLDRSSIFCPGSFRGSAIPANDDR